MAYDQVAALRAAQLELEPLTLRVLEHVAALLLVRVRVRLGLG